MTKPKVQNYLHELIKNLSQTEKRYFKLLAKQQTPSKKNDYIRLFEEIDKQEVFNEEAIKEKFKGTPIEKRYPSLKKYLYELVVKSLTFYNADTLPSVRVRRIIDAVEILQNKGLYHQALRKLKKAEELSNEIGLLGSTQEIKRLKLHCLAKMNEFPNWDELSAFKHDQAKLSKAIQLNNEIYNNNLDMLAISNNKQASSGIVEPQNNLRLKDITQPKEKIEIKHNKLLYYNSLINYYELTNNLVEAEKFVDKILLLFHSNELQIKLLPTKYIHALFFKINYLKNQNKNNEIALFLEKSNIFFNDNTITYYSKNSDYGYFLNIEQEFYLIQNDLNKIFLQVKKVEDFVLNKRTKLGTSLHNTLLINLAWAQLRCGRNKGVLGSLKNIILKSDNLDYQNMIHSKKLLTTIVYLESKNFELFESSSKNLEHALQKCDASNDILKELSKTFHKLLLCFGDDTLQKIQFKQLHNRLEEIENSENDMKKEFIKSWVKNKSDFSRKAILN